MSKLPEPQDFNQGFNVEALNRGIRFSKATLVVEPIRDPRNDEEIEMEKRGNWILNQPDGRGVQDWISAPHALSRREARDRPTR